MLPDHQYNPYNFRFRSPIQTVQMPYCRNASEKVLSLLLSGIHNPCILRLPPDRHGWSLLPSGIHWHLSSPYDWCLPCHFLKAPHWFRHTDPPRNIRHLHNEAVWSHLLPISLLPLPYTHQPDTDRKLSGRAKSHCPPAVWSVRRKMRAHLLPAFPVLYSPAVSCFPMK